MIILYAGALSKVCVSPREEINCVSGKLAFRWEAAALGSNTCLISRRVSHKKTLGTVVLSKDTRHTSFLQCGCLQIYFEDVLLAARNKKGISSLGPFIKRAYLLFLWAISISVYYILYCIYIHIMNQSADNTITQQALNSLYAPVKFKCGAAFY